MPEKKISGSDIQKVISTINGYSSRPKDSRGRPGGLIEWPRDLTPIIIGDLHACTENLQRILDHDHNEKKLAKGTHALLFLGDTMHNDQTGQLKEMDSSLVMLEKVFRLFLKYGDRVYYLRGNHDSFDDRLVKSGIQQGVELRNLIVRQRSLKYAELVDRFFASLPMFVIGRGFVLTHAGPVRGGIGRLDLIDIYDDLDKFQQLMWNRINEFRGTPSSKEYDGYDIRKTLEKLNMPEGTPFIVGHNPLWNTGNTTGVWQNVLGIQGHYILYSGANTLAPYITFVNRKMAVHYAITPKKEAIYA